MTFSQLPPLHLSLFFFFNDTATTEIYTLSLHDALPISTQPGFLDGSDTFSDCLIIAVTERHSKADIDRLVDRKSTRLNSSHLVISYAVFCLKKKHLPDARNAPFPTPPPVAPFVPGLPPL